MIIYYDLDAKSTLTAEEKSIIDKARKMPITYDEDAPRLTEELKQAVSLPTKKHVQWNKPGQYSCLYAEK